MKIYIIKIKNSNTISDCYYNTHNEALEVLKRDIKPQYLDDYEIVELENQITRQMRLIRKAN